MRPTRAIYPILALLLWAGSAMAAPRVLVVLSKPDAPYAALVQSLRDHLASTRAAQTEIAVERVEEFSAVQTRASAPTLIVAVGVEAARRVAQANPPAPILHTLLPRVAALDVLRTGRGGKPTPHRDSAIFLDQPIGRQLDLIRLALPRAKRIAVVLGPATQQLAGELRDAARQRTLTLNTVTLKRRDDLLPMLEDMLDENDVLLSVADPLVYHSETIHHVLLTTYRYKVPVLGLSRAYVDAGALLAVYSTPEQIGRQTAQLVSTLPESGGITLPAPAYPRFFLISVNRRVAASLDLVLDSENALQHKLEALSRP